MSGFNPQLAAYHEGLYLTAKEEDELYEEYLNDKARDTPTPFEIKIAMRQMREQRKALKILDNQQTVKSLSPKVYPHPRMK